ncbi:glycoside hydrolase family 31 protein [Infundibulicybe gibba]|nr:glycoside hydrolase family 31 protein [Infundibulicybe gibba]
MLSTTGASSSECGIVAATTNSSYFQPNSTGIKLQNGFERVYIQPFGNHGVRVRASLMRDPLGPGGSASLRNGNLVARVSNGIISFLRVEPNGTTSALLSEYIDTKALQPRYYFAFSSDPNEQIYGAGSRHKGQVVDLINYNSHVTLPVYMSNKGYLQFFNMPSQGRLEFGTLRTRFVASEATVVDYYVTTAQPGDYDALQQQYTGVTGRQPTPPDFMLGYQQSKLRYFNQTQVMDIAQRFHDEKVNVSLIVVDFFAWKFQGDWSFDPQFWPDPAGMAADVKRLTGAEMMVSLWPSVEDLSVNYLTLQENGLLATTRDGPGVQDSFNGVYTRLVDSTNPAAREFLWKRLNDSYFSKGIHNFWIDQADGGTLGEPFENNGQAIASLPFARSFAQYFIGTQEGAGKMYPWLHQQAIDEGFHNLTGTTKESTACQFMSLTRSTFAGGQRFCSYLWSGDTDSRFDVLLQQITSGVSVAASGISSWTLDIGGFSGLDVDSDAGRELFVRWLAMGVFLPYPWAYGDANFIIIKKYITLRYQLIPYVKTLFVMLQATGRTIMRSLFYDFSLSDQFVVDGTRNNDPLIIHQFMFGPRLLVAPVGTPNTTVKEVYLPLLSESMKAAQFSWKHWWTDKDFGQGGKSINISAGLDEIPVFYLGEKQDILAGHI